MNIFVLDYNPHLAARYHSDRHIVKMVLETAQLLCTAHRVLDGDDCIAPNVLYKSTHVNHPCAVWARDCYANYIWLYDLFVSLCEEYTFRYEKTHLSEKMLKQFLSQPPKNIADTGDYFPDSFAMAMPDEYKQACPVQAYREYYVGEKQKLLEYIRGREFPWWMEDE